MRDNIAGQLGDALYLTRMIRFGLEAMWTAMDALPDEMQASDDDVRAALRTISDWLAKTEAARLRDMRTAREYAIIRPVSLLDPPPPEAMTAIAAAVSVLHRHDLIITESGD